MNTERLYLKAVAIYREFVDIIMPCKNIDFNIRGVIMWARENATPKQKYDFLSYFYGEYNMAVMTGAYQMAVSSAVIYKDPFNDEALSKLDISKLFEIFEISGCPTEYFSIYFLEYKRVSKIRSRTYMNKIRNNRQEYNDFISKILK